jgi:hypothetical protein
MLEDVQALPFSSRRPGPIATGRTFGEPLRTGGVAPWTPEGRAMQNDVYGNTRRELAELVSPRAAQRVLDDALRASGQRADTIDAAGMRKLLLGPVRRQLASVLPRSGLTRSLKRIAAAVAASAKGAAVPKGATSAGTAPNATGVAAEATSDAAPSTPASESPATAPAAWAEARSAVATSRPAARPSSVPDSAVKRSSVYLPDLPGLRLTPKPPTKEVRQVAPRPTAIAMPTRANPPGAARRPDAVTVGASTVVAGRRMDDAAMEATVRTFGALETVRQVVIVRGNSVALERGEAIDAQRLPTLVRSTRHLLARGGDLRVFSLEHARGVLFVFPMGTDAIVVVTRPNVNIGAVLTARAALEEAA